MEELLSDRVPPDFPTGSISRQSTTLCRPCIHAIEGHHPQGRIVEVALHKKVSLDDAFYGQNRTFLVSKNCQNESRKFLLTATSDF